jgi:DNA-binding protein HU-beta
MDMKRNELISAVAERTGKTKKEINYILGETFDLISETLSDGEEIYVSGFGTFGLTKRNARRGVSPINGEDIIVPAFKTVKFKTSSALKRLINS